MMAFGYLKGITSIGLSSICICTLRLLLIKAANLMSLGNRRVIFFMMRSILEKANALLWILHWTGRYIWLTFQRAHSCFVSSRMPSGAVRILSLQRNLPGPGLH